MQNKRVRTATEKAYILFAVLVAVAGIIAISSYAGKAVVKASQIPTVYMTHGDTDICVKAQDAQGNEISCVKAMKGAYHTEWIAPKTLND